MISFFEEYVRVSGMDENAAAKEFNTSKHHVLNVLKKYVYGEMKEEMDRKVAARTESK